MSDAETIARPAAVWATVGAVVGIFLTPAYGGPVAAYGLGIAGGCLGAFLGWRIVRRRRNRW